MSKGDNNTNTLDFIRHIYDWNQRLIERADTKVGILLAINAIALLLPSTWDISVYDLYPKIIMIFATILSASSSLLFILAILPWKPKDVLDTLIWTGGILKNTKEQYAAKISARAMDKEKILKDYVNQVYILAQIQNEKYRYIEWGLRLLSISIVSIALSFLLQNVCP